MKILHVCNQSEPATSIGVNLLEAEFSSLALIPVTQPSELELAVDDGEFSAVLLYHPLNWIDSLDALEKLFVAHPSKAIIMIAENGSEELAVQGLKLGLHDYLTRATIERLPGAIRSGLVKSSFNQLEQKQSSLLLQTVLDHALDWEEWTSPSGELLHISPACEQITGYRVEEFRLNPRLIEEIVHPDERQMLVAHRSQIVQTPARVDNLEFRIQHRDGSWRWINHSCQPIFRPDGYHLGQRETNRDITEQKQIELALRESGQLNRALLQYDIDPIVVIDPEHRIIFANEAFSRHIQQPIEQIIGLPAEQIYPDLLKDIHRDMLECLIQTRQTVRMEYQGQTAWYENTLAPVFDPDGAVRLMVLRVRDITHHKQIENQIEHNYQVMQALLKAPASSILLIDREGLVQDASEGLANRFSAAGETMIGEPLWKFIAPEQSEELQANIQAVLSGSKYQRFRQRKNDTVYDIALHPILDLQGNIERITVLIHDISEFEKAEETLFQKNEILHTVLNNAPIGLFAFDTQGLLTFADGRALVEMGIRADRVVGHNLFETVKNHTPVIERLKQVLQGQDYVDVIPGPANRLYETRYTALRDSQGVVIGGLGISVDITEYKAIQDELRQSKNQLEVILDGVQDGITVLDVSGKLIYANAIAAQLGGYTSTEELLKSDVYSDQFEFTNETGNVIPVDDLPGRRLLLGRKNPAMIVRLHRKGVDDERWTYVKDTAVMDEYGQLVMVVTIIHDITETKRAEMALQQAHLALEQRIAERTQQLARANQELRGEVVLRRQAEMQFRRSASRAEALATMASRLNAHLDLQVLLQRLTDETLKAVSYPACSLLLVDNDRDQLILAASTGHGYELFEEVPPVPRELFESYRQAIGPIIVIPDVQAIPEDFAHDLLIKSDIRTVIVVALYSRNNLLGLLATFSIGEIRLPSQDEMLLLQALADQATAAIANATLFQEVNDSRNNLQKLSQKLVEAQELERRHLARELHDEIGQMLTSLSLNLNHISQGLHLLPSTSANILDELSKTGEMVDHLLQQVRDLSLDLRPSLLDDLGLLPALLALFERYTTQTGVCVNFRHSQLQDRYPPEVETAAFRMVQEALTNVSRYANVQEATVRLWADGQHLGVQVEDHGAGFNPQQIEPGASTGLSGMRERVNLCGGHLDIESNTGCGTCLTAEFPLVQEP